MNLIDRQAAIDAIKEFYRGAKEWKDEQEERSDIWHRADSAIASALEIGLRIKKLPSAQPEIIRCKDCAKHECCRTSTVWAIPPKDDWYCADAERRNDG